MDASPADRDLLYDALDLINVALGTPFAVASHIDGERFTVLEVADEVGTPIEAGAEYETAETFCRTIEDCGRVEAIPAVAADDRVNDRFLHTQVGLESYLGIPLVVDGEQFGAVAVCDLEPRAFDEEDRRRARSAARLAEVAIGGSRR